MSVIKPIPWLAAARNVEYHYPYSPAVQSVSRISGRKVTIELAYDTGVGLTESNLGGVGGYEVPLFCVPWTCQLIGTHLNVLTAVPATAVASCCSVDPTTGITSAPADTISGACYFESTSLNSVTNHGFIPGCRWYSKQPTRAGTWCVIQIYGAEVRLNIEMTVELMLGDEAVSELTERPT